jgi:hypothetical protein
LRRFARHTLDAGDARRAALRSAPVWLVGGLAAIAAFAGGRPATPVSSFDHAPYDRILGEIVVGERVDYALLAERHLDALDGYLEAIGTIDPGDMPDSDQLALYVNLYNATVLSAVAHRYEPGYSVAERDFALFDEPLVRVAGKRASLNDLEHRLIRREFDDPRVHAALVCAARSCPPLIDRAYEGKTLDRTLERRMRLFVNDPERNTIDPDGHRLALSKIFEWYAEDFGGPDALAEFVDRYTELEVGAFDVEFRPYSWELNDVER